MADEPPDESITTSANAYVLAGADGTVWVAPIPTVEPAGVMPHLAPGDPVHILDRDAAGNLTVQIPPKPPNEMSSQLRAYVVSPGLARELLGLPAVTDSPDAGNGSYTGNGSYS